MTSVRASSPTAHRARAAAIWSPAPNPPVNQMRMQKITMPPTMATNWVRAVETIVSG